MKKVFLVTAVCFLFMVVNIAAQDTIRGILINPDGAGVPYGNIVCLNSSYGATSDSLGNFILPVKALNDQFKVSSIGYQSSVVSGTFLFQDAVIILDPSMVEMGEVEVVCDVKKFRNKRIGWTSKRGNYYLASLPGNQFSTKIKCPAKWQGSYLERISFLIAKVGSRHSPLRVRVLAVNSVGLPGSDLIAENIIVNSYNSDVFEKVTVDLKTFGLKMPDSGVFISIEWLDVWMNTDGRSRCFFCTKDYIKVKMNSKGALPSPAIAMSRNKEPYSFQNFRDKRWHPMSSFCRVNVSAVLRKIID